MLKKTSYEPSDILQRHSGSKSTCFRVGDGEFCLNFTITDIHFSYLLLKNSTGNTRYTFW